MNGFSRKNACVQEKQKIVDALKKLIEKENVSANFQLKRKKVIEKVSYHTKAVEKKGKDLKNDNLKCQSKIEK